MAQKVEVILEDDLDGGPAEETVRFGLGGREYEIDLSGKNARRLRKAVEPYVSRGRKTHQHRTRPAATRRRTADIRAWAKQSGYMDGDRGRIPDWIVTEYDRVHTT